MKPGKLSRSIEKPSAGFSFRREGYKIYISYIEPSSIHKLDSKKEYEYIQYSYYGAIHTYEELVNKSILLKYNIESELSLMSKAIVDPKNSEYLAYREFVDLCKNECKNIYAKLGLIKNEIDN